MIEERFVGILYVFDESVHLCICVSLSYVSNMDAASCIGCLLDGFVCCRLLSLVVDEDVGWHYLMGE